MPDNILTIPSDVPPYAILAWAAALQWAITEPDICKAFEAETGLRFVTPKNGLDVLIDEATGAREAYIKAFVPWFNVNVWGPCEGKESADGK